MTLHAEAQSPQETLSISEYFALEYRSAQRHEYHAGQVIAMAGGSSEHARIAFNTIGELHSALKGKPSRGFSNHLRIGVPPTPFFYYPDLSVVCGELQFDPRDPQGQSVTNPRLIIEVLSPSTEIYDRTDKFDAFMKLESLEEFVLISQDRPRVESRARVEGGNWLLSNAIGLEESILLRSLGLSLALRDIYAGIAFPNPPNPPPGDTRNSLILP